MLLTIKEIKRKFPEWTAKNLNENDFEIFCLSNDIEIVETPLKYNIKAILWFVENTFVITVDSRLNGIPKLFGMWHEVGHFLIHAPTKTIGSYFWGDEQIYKGNRKQENEADIFALCAIIPTHWVEIKTYNELLDEGFTENQLNKRKEIYEKHNI